MATGNWDTAWQLATGDGNWRQGKRVEGLISCSLPKDLIALDKHLTAKSARNNPAAAVTHAKLIPPGTT